MDILGNIFVFEKILPVQSFSAFELFGHQEAINDMMSRLHIQFPECAFPHKQKIYYFSHLDTVI